MAPELTKLKKMRETARSLRTATSSWRERFGDTKHYDKQAFAFTRFTDRSTAAFKVPPMVFDAYAGVYGNSSVSRQWNVDQAIVDRHFVEALNANKQLIFDTMAKSIEAEAEQLTEAAKAELKALQAMLDDAESLAA